MATLSGVMVESALRSEGDSALAGTGYRQVHRIGAGGMGEVFEAERNGRSVVVKVMHPNLVCTPELVDRMRIEGEVLAKLRHPNLVEVEAFGCNAQGRPFIAMQKLQGRTLREELDARGPLRAEEAIEVAGQLLSALEALHQAGVVHRDLKPANVFLCVQADGQKLVKLLDLGIAKVLSQAPERFGLAPPEHRTREGVYVGTPSYAAPEQILGAGIDHRTDVYGVGLVLYALLTGRSARDGVATKNLVYEVEPPSRRAPHPIPSELDQVVLKALENLREQRFQSAMEFAQALAAIARDLSAPAGWTRTRWFDLGQFQQRLSDAAFAPTVANAQPTRREGKIAPKPGSTDAAATRVMRTENEKGDRPVGAKRALSGIGFGLIVATSAVVVAGLCTWLLLRLAG
jgi:serine/threonine-protein kinase